MSGTRQKIQYSLALEPVERGETPVSGYQGAEPFVAKPAPQSPALTEPLMEEVCDRENLVRAWKRVRRNKGSPGMDGMTIDDAKDYLREHWPSIRSQLLKSGHIHVVDADLQSYFDTIPKDRLLALVGQKVSDRRILSLIEAFLEQGVLDGLDQWTPERGTPQGAVCTPLLSNIYLDPLDHLMEARGFAMVRYADDGVPRTH